MEGTVVLHITFAVKQDQDLGKEFIKYLKVLANGWFLKYYPLVSTQQLLSCIFHIVTIAVYQFRTNMSH